MKKIFIEEDTLDLIDNDSVEYAEGMFATEDEIEVRIPFNGYYSITVKCKDPQTAMLEVLKMDDVIGITSIEGTNTIIEDADIDETYCLVNRLERKQLKEGK